MVGYGVFLTPDSPSVPCRETFLCQIFSRSQPPHRRDSITMAEQTLPTTVSGAAGAVGTQAGQIAEGRRTGDR
jgi:hypothetical protein